MPGSFKIRVLLAIVMLTLIGFLAQSTGGRGVIEPALTYTFATDYSQRIADSLNAWAPLPGRAGGAAVPAATQSMMQPPCAIIAVKKPYGWQWNADRGQRELFPGVYVQLAADSMVYPLLPGTVTDVVTTGPLCSVRVEHDDGLESFYAGLKQVQVAVGQRLAGDECLGYSGAHLYFELQRDQQPLDPGNIFV